MFLASFEIIDISPMISPELGVFPGDCAFTRRESMAFTKGDHLTLSEMTTTMHLGAHADAPIHYHSEGVSIEKRSLDYYVGDVQVVEVKIKNGDRIKPEHLTSKIERPRVLFKTNSFPHPNRWNHDFCSFDSSMIQFLADQGVKLVGIDTPSVDPETDKELLAHKKIFENDMAILEGLVLTHVAPGFYFLSALPLKIKGSEAAPVRAVLLKANQHD
jgi:arylformamidase